MVSEHDTPTTDIDSTERSRGTSGSRPLTALLLDESDSDRHLLETLLQWHPAVTVAATARTSAEGLEWLRTHTPDVIFCEVHFKGISLPELVTSFPSRSQLVVTTTDKEFGWRAFDLDAVDFLPKPISRERLGMAVRRLMRIEWRPAQPSRQDTALRALVPFEQGRRAVRLEEICYIEACGSYSLVHLASGAKEIVLRSLVRWQQMLPFGSFVQIHRHTLVNRARIRALETEAGAHVVAVDGVEELLPVSRRQAPQLKKQLFETHRVSA